MTDQHLIPLEELNLSVRAYNCLHSVQVNSVFDLVRLSYDDLLEIKNFGSKSADDVIEALERIGMTLRRGPRAALAEQPMEPTDEELCETYRAAYYAEKNRQGPACQAAGLRAVLAKWGKDPLLAIADELERQALAALITADQDLAAACREWIKGCTCAARDTPQECEECTSAFLQAVLDRAQRHDLEIGQNLLEALPND